MDQGPFLEQYIYHHIPLVQAMGIKVEEATPQKVILSAPIELNLNHKQTAFGGSLHAIATLCCWSILFLNLKRHGYTCEIVIGHSEADYLVE